MLNLKLLDTFTVACFIVIITLVWLTISQHESEEHLEQLLQPDVSRPFCCDPDLEEIPTTATQSMTWPTYPAGNYMRPDRLCPLPVQVISPIFTLKTKLGWWASPSTFSISYTGRKPRLMPYSCRIWIGVFRELGDSSGFKLHAYKYVF